jgi:hypothetical protein
MLFYCPKSPFFWSDYVCSIFYVITTHTLLVAAERLADTGGCIRGGSEGGGLSEQFFGRELSMGLCNATYTKKSQAGSEEDTAVLRRAFLSGNGTDVPTAAIV